MLHAQQRNITNFGKTIEKEKEKSQKSEKKIHFKEKQWEVISNVNGTESNNMSKSTIFIIEPKRISNDKKSFDLNKCNMHYWYSFEKCLLFSRFQFMIEFLTKH